MNLKHYVRYAVCIVVISCVALLIKNLLCDNNNNISDKSNTATIKSIETDNYAKSFPNSNETSNKRNRIIVKPSENNSSSERDTTDNGNRTKVPVPSTNDNLKVQPLPPADDNAQIIVNLLK